MNYGNNKCDMPASIKTTDSTDRTGIDIAVPDPSKDLIRNRGVRTGETLRDEMARGGRPTTFGHKNPNAKNPTIPGALDLSGPGNYPFNPPRRAG
jgi:hypothetical protein